MKPLLRWVVGPVGELGLRILRNSVRNIVSMYGERFDYLICYNQISADKLSLGIPLFCQDHLRNALGYDVAWKLFPVRVRAESHEIVIDNDLVLFKKLDEIENFLVSDHTLTYQGLHGAHGNYYVPKGMRLNSGIYGMPPGFDIDLSNRTFSGKFDEQGLIVSSLLSWHHCDVIPMTAIPIIESDFPIDEFWKLKSTKGFHFVGANRGKHPQCEKFLTRLI